MTLDCFEHKRWHHCIKLEFQKIVNFLDTTSDDKDLPSFVTKKWIEFYDESEVNYNVTADDFEAPNNTADYANVTKTANNNAFGEKKVGF